MVSDLRRQAVSRSDSISRHQEIGTIPAAGSPLSPETYWISTGRAEARCKLKLAARAKTAPSGRGSATVAN